MKKLTAGIFFTMAGSWAVALKELGINIKWHYCIKEFHEVFSLNFPEILMTDKLSDINEEVDLIVGSPPCIGMSSANPNAKIDHNANQETLNFAMVVEILRPKAFIMEMVPTIIRPKFEYLFNQYKSVLQMNYSFVYRIINFVDYGTPQVRKRFIILGLRKDNLNEIIFPNPSNKKITIKEAFYGLPKLTEKKAVEQELTRKFNPKWKAPFSKYIHNPGYFQLKWEGVAPPFTAMGGVYFKHPDFLEDNLEYHRLITYREAARLQEFPDNFRFVGKFSKQVKQISWGVPCKGIQPFIKKLLSLIKENKNEKENNR